MKRLARGGGGAFGRIQGSIDLRSPVSQMNVVPRASEGLIMMFDFKEVHLEK